MDQENLLALASEQSAKPGIALQRLDAIDLLRGIVMVVMALDHTRGFFSEAISFSATDLTKTNAALFLTRWITHFCAPVFVFLAGTGAFLSTYRGKTQRELSRFLLTRGLWLIVLEQTVVRCLGWEYNFDYHFMHTNVLWAIGWAMVVLSGLVFLPLRFITGFGIVMIAGHNLLDKLRPESLGAFGWLWKVLHIETIIEWRTGFTFEFKYPLIPWIGVLAVGYGFGTLMLRERQERRKLLFWLGSALTLLFVVLRATNLYGDPSPWTPQASKLFTVFSFINCTKYPPSLLYLLMTLGPAFIVLALLDRDWGKVVKPLLVFGRVPLFYYVLHLFLIHLLAVIFSVVRYGHLDKSLFENPPFPSTPKDFGYGLPVVYGVTMLVVMLLYPACRWFAALKKQRKDAWLSYL
ncbi:MAG: DUF1624 domain-containing protein [Acidobacteria bacterium]|nr:DUF1624 domain-containing protein [Acidobacteriota bacterium]